MVGPGPLVKLALSSFARFNGLLYSGLEKNNSEAASILDFFGATSSFRGDFQMVIASLSLSKERIEKLTKLAGELREEASASATSRQILAGKLSFAQAASMGRFGRASLEPIYEFMTGG